MDLLLRPGPFGAVPFPFEDGRQSLAALSGSGSSSAAEGPEEDLVLVSAAAVPSASQTAGGIWSRSAGRKKSHPVWAFFRDLRDSNGVGGVECLHCEWTGDDRSPNNLKTHLRRCHEADGVFKQFTLNLALTPTQPYVKRKRVQQQQQQTEPDPHHQQPQLHEDGQPNSRRHSPVTTPPQQQNTSSQGSAFSKYSTAALIGAISQQQANNDASGGKKSPVHGAEAPRPAQKVQQLPAPRPKYGLEAITGLNAAQLAMLGVADPALLSNLEAAATMNHLMSECAKQRPTLPTPTAQQPNNNSPQLNELRALYASAAAASALQQQHGKAADQQQQMAAQQAAATAAASWIYNWEWLAAAQRNSALVANNKFATAQPNGKNANVAMMPLLSALNLGGGNPAALETRTAAAAKENSHSGANGALLGNKTSAFEQVPMKQAQNQREQQHGQKRKSPVEQEQHQLNNSSLLVLAEASTAAAAEQQQRMQQQQQNGGGASPPKRRTKEDPKENPQQQQQQQQQQQENQNALAESLVLYGMHRIAMELQLSYSVHANKLGKAEYAFYCTNAGMANANIQKMVTLTESTDQVLHIREYANGAVVAEECWPKSAEPGTLLLSLRDKCQRRLCAI